ncbi:MAG TPA: phospholipase D-like domain-containing protein [Patescibacteria group bacterium]|jgi:phosphatidylserine/phosphatidylglycerophosphate/cardiolipin synthase-like enzyme|nr:phospholipase D-like domain-containing protein [Patescibacteria group bacterium]
MEDSNTPSSAPNTPKRKSYHDAAYLIVIALLIALSGQFYYTYHYKPLAERQVRVYYNHDIRANQEITNTIQDANKFVYFAIYTFTRDDIRDALLAAEHRGLEVRGIMDKNQSKSIDAQKQIVKELQDAGIEIVFNNHNYIMHMKTVVTDKGYVSGSYNWTAAATDNNDEIIEVGNDETIRKQYEKTLTEVIDKYKALQTELQNQAPIDQPAE